MLHTEISLQSAIVFCIFKTLFIFQFSLVDSATYAIACMQLMLRKIDGDEH
jgi:hypothetical protein